MLLLKLYYIILMTHNFCLSSGMLSHDTLPIQFLFIFVIVFLMKVIIFEVFLVLIQFKKIHFYVIYILNKNLYKDFQLFEKDIVKTCNYRDYFPVKLQYHHHLVCYFVNYILLINVQ